MYKNEIPAEFGARQARRVPQVCEMPANDIQPDHQSDLTKLEQDLAVERERYLRLAADFDNHRKRIAREMDRRASSQKEALVRDLLPVIDNLERALGANPDDDLREGVKMIYEQMLETVKRHGFEPRDDLGQPFDGRFHDGLAVSCRPEMPDLSIVEVWERGWMRGTEMFRPAKVRVNKLNENIG
jgi:molecular chaperone GrpE